MGSRASRTAHPGQVRAGPRHPAVPASVQSLKRTLNPPGPSKKSLGLIQSHRCPSVPSRRAAGDCPGLRARRAPLRSAARCRQLRPNSATLFCQSPPGQLPAPSPALGTSRGGRAWEQRGGCSSAAPQPRRPRSLSPASCARSGASPREEAEVSYSPVTMNSRGALNIR